MALCQRSRDRVDPDEEDSGRGSWLPLIVAAVALLSLGAWIGRASKPDPQPATPPAVTSPDADDPIDWPGPTDTEDGAPVGFERTEAGAVAAAAQYAKVLGRAHGEELSKALDVVAATDAREELRETVETQLRTVQEGLGFAPEDPDFAAVAAYARYGVESYRDNAATVLLWGTGFVVDPRVGAPGLDAAGASWSTTTIGLVWEQDDWRLSRFRITDGPSPADANSGDPRWTTRAMNEFEELWHVPPIR